MIYLQNMESPKFYQPEREPRTYLSAFGALLVESRRNIVHEDEEGYFHRYDPDFEKKLLTTDGVESFLRELNINLVGLQVETKIHTYKETIDESTETQNHIMGHVDTVAVEIVIKKNDTIIFKDLVTLKTKYS